MKTLTKQQKILEAAHDSDLEIELRDWVVAMLHIYGKEGLIEDICDIIEKEEAENPDLRYRGYGAGIGRR